MARAPRSARALPFTAARALCVLILSRASAPACFLPCARLSPFPGPGPCMRGGTRGSTQHHSGSRPSFGHTHTSCMTHPWVTALWRSSPCMRLYNTLHAVRLMHSSRLHRACRPAVTRAPQAGETRRAPHRERHAAAGAGVARPREQPGVTMGVMRAPSRTARVECTSQHRLCRAQVWVGAGWETKPWRHKHM